MLTAAVLTSLFEVKNFKKLTCRRLFDIPIFLSKCLCFPEVVKHLRNLIGPQKKRKQML